LDGKIKTLCYTPPPSHYKVLDLLLPAQAVLCGFDVLEEFHGYYRIIGFQCETKCI
jgi:hypothetical protein